MKLVRGFLMAWGCFCWIPCPYKQWHEEDRTAMVAMLPLVGTGLGLVTALVWALAGALGAGPVLCGAVVTGAYFIMTGFIHLDGFMDVSDAVMPRHPQMEERRRILKDPHTGSFAAVSMALMLLIFAASAMEMSGLWSMGALVFIAVATTSRCVSAMSVILCAPMETSQYHSTEFEKRRGFAASLPALVIALVIVAACAASSLQSGIQELSSTIGPGAEATAALEGVLNTAMEALSADAIVGGASLTTMTFGWAPAFCVLAAAGVCAVTELIIGALDRRSLGGMNGDISGHMITSGEMAGLLVAAILMG